MKKTALAATLLVAIIIACVSYKFFFNKHPESSFSINGTWKIDSTNNVVLLFALKDTSVKPLQAAIIFNADSSFYVTSTKEKAIADTGDYYVDDKQKLLFVKSDSIYQPLHIHLKNDSSLQLVSDKDSTWYSLSKTK
jgi:hypothetical protein